MPEEGGSAAPAAKRPRRGGAAARDFVGAGSDSVGAARGGVVLAAVRGEAAPTTLFSL